MVYQSLKYFMIRVGWSLLLLLTFGYVVLYVIHEMALPGTQFDDTAIQWVLAGISVFFGFLVFGLIGEQRFHNAMHALKDVDSTSDPAVVISCFENLLRLSESSYFLPRKGRSFWRQAILKYGEYLLSIGKNDDAAMRVYLRAFLENPRDGRFRAPLLTILGKGAALSPQEIDLLLVMLKAENFQDTLISRHLAAVFLRHRKLSPKTEPLLLASVESVSDDARNILEFVVPQLIRRGRMDEAALKFYLQALPVWPQDHESNRMRELLGRAYCDEIWKGANPDFHGRLGRVFDGLDSGLKERLVAEVEANRAALKLKKIRLFTRKDLRQLEHLKTRLGISLSVSDWIFRGVVSPFRFLSGLFKRILLKGMDGLIAFGGCDLKTKLLVIAVVSTLLVIGVSYTEWIGQQLGGEGGQVREPAVAGTPSPGAPGSLVPSDKVHTIQVAAVTKRSQADRFIAALKRRGVEGIYFVKSKRMAGGNWYKIRVGQFPNAEEAQRFAQSLIDRNIVKNYFILSLPKGSIQG